MNPRLDRSLLTEIESWTEEGERSVDIEIKNTRVRIWCYDYNLKSGFFVKEKSDILSRDQMIAYAKKSALEMVSTLENLE